MYNIIKEIIIITAIAHSQKLYPKYLPALKITITNIIGISWDNFGLFIILKLVFS
jgi:hypothetical protein